MPQYNNIPASRGEEESIVIKFADDFLKELKEGCVLICLGGDDDFTRKAEYEVHKDEDDLYIIDDNGDGELLNIYLSEFFAIKD